MKKLISLTCIFVFILALGGVASAEVSTPKEVVAKVAEAAKLLAEKGEAAFDTIRDKKGPYVWKDNYLYVFSNNSVILAHPFVPKLEGRNMTNVKDITGKLFNVEAAKIANSPEGKGWFGYYWPKPGAKKPSLKAGYVMGVPGRDMYVGSGIWDMTPEEAAEKAK
jgi:cytochrome c